MIMEPITTTGSKQIFVCSVTTDVWNVQDLIMSIALNVWITTTNGPTIQYASHSVHQANTTKQETNLIQITKQNAFPAIVDVSYVLIEIKIVQGALAKIMILQIVLPGISMPIIMIILHAWKYAQLHQTL